ncbi:MAG: hypothetical protein JSS49_15255 [Planctomycetes bacterium]|nr:hypothetical protein [Planctomycetota bacterium]
MKRILIASGIVSAMAGCDQAPPPKTTIISVTITQEQREKLSPLVRQLLSDVETGKAADAIASNYSAVLKEASERNDFKTYTEYGFILDGQSEAESHPYLVVQVDKESGRIKRCGVVEPCW